MSDNAYLYVERGYQNDNATNIVLAILFTLGGVLMLGGTLTATFLALSDARPDLATLSAVGATPRTRRGVAAAYALVVGFVGALLGAAVGFIPGIAITYPLTSTSWAAGGWTRGATRCPSHFIDVPWTLVIGLVVVLPLLTALIVGLTARSRLPLVARLDRETSRLDCLFVQRHDGRVPAVTVRVPQEERTRAMRARLMEATVELLVERGFAGTSTTLVSERAGVSRGAQLHHFPTKNDLVVAAVEHLTEVRGAELAAAAERGLPRGARRTRAVLALLADHFTSPVFTAALELWVAARTDASLRAAVVPLEQRVGRQTHRMTVELLGADESRAGHRELVQATLDLVRGLGLADTITDDTRRRKRILDRWALTLDQALAR